MVPPKQIAVFLPSWVGDAVMATPVLRSLRREAPDARIHWIGKPAPLATLRGPDWADEMLPDLSAQKPRLRGALRMARQLRSRRIEMALLLPNSFRTAAVAWAGRAQRRVGYDRDGRGWLLTEKLTPPRDASGQFEPISALDYYARLAEHAGVRIDSRRMELATTDQADRQADELFAQAGIDKNRPVVTLNPGASFGPSKMWPVDRYAAVADALAEEFDAQIIVNAAPSEQAVAAGCARQMQTRPALNFAEQNNSLPLLKSILKRTDLLVTNDTGSRHVGAAMGASVVTLFLSTAPRWAEIHYDRERKLVADVPCHPCQRKQCPLTGEEHHRCARAVSVERVLEACRELLLRRQEGAEQV